MCVWNVLCMEEYVCMYEVCVYEYMCVTVGDECVWGGYVCGEGCVWRVCMYGCVCEYEYACIHVWGDISM